MKLQGVSIIGSGRGKPAGAPKAAVNPATGLAIGPDFFWASDEELSTAVQLADQAFREFGHWSGNHRRNFLNHLAELLEANGPSIIERAHLETALPVARLQGELARTCFQLRLYGEAAASGLSVGARIDHGNPGRKPLPKPDLRSMMVPLGPVVVFSASNFPLAFSVAGGDTASAFAAGCPVIVKPHHGHLGTSELVGTLIQQAAQAREGPEGLFSMLYGDGPQLGISLVKHPLVKAVGFTGSRRGGRALMDAAAARLEPIPVFAEMGSINPMFLLADVLAQRAEEIAAGLHGSVTMGVGQFCTSPGLVFVESSRGATDFLAKLQSLMAHSPAGTMLTAGLCSAYRHGVETISQVPGVKTLTGIAADSGEGKAQVHAALFLTDVETFLHTDSLMNEVFGPSTLVVECETPAQMVAAAERVEGQLTATIFATPAELADSHKLIDVLQAKAGRILFNGYPTGVEVAHAMTHGGPYPATADGRSSSVGTRAIERFLRPVTFQNFPDEALPEELQELNPFRILRLQDGVLVVPSAIE